MNESPLAADPTPPAPLRSRLRAYLYKNWLRCVVLGITGFVVRMPSLQGQLVWDDDYLIRTNPFIKSPVLFFEAFRHYLFLDSYSRHYRPVQNFSYMADYLVWNTNYWGYHLTSILFHVGSGVLLYLLLRRLLNPLFARPTETGLQPQDGSGTASWVAFFIALLWVVHPVHSAAVDYVSGRADSLGFFFACGGWLLFLKARELRQRSWRWLLYSAAWLSGLASLCSRESACIWVFIFLFYVFVFDKTVSARRKGMLLAACVFLLAAYFGLRQLPTAREVPGPSSGWPGSVRVVLMLRALGDYGRLMVFPSNLHMERTVYNPATFYNEQARWGWIHLEYLSMGGLILIATTAWFAWRRSAGQRARLFGLAWFLLAFLPISNLIDLNATVAEHWLYLPSVGFLIFLVGCGLDLPAKWRPAGVAFLCLAVIGLGVRSSYRSSDWSSTETFARRTIASGGTTIRVAMLLAQTYSNRGDYVEAEKILRRALQLAPDYPSARNNLAEALSHQGKEKEARALLAEATKSAENTRKDYPRTWMAALNYASMLHNQQNDALALAVLKKARKDYPETWEVVSSQSELLRETKKLDESLALLREYAGNHWWHYAAWMGIGRVLAEKGDAAGADSALRHASRLDVRSTEALNLIALMHMRQNRLEDAWLAQRRAVARQPDQPRQYVLLSNILDKMGRGDEARAALAEVTRLRTLADSTKIAN